MAKEILAVPEEKLEEVIHIIRTGMKHVETIDSEVEEQLKKWCDSEEEYLESISEDS